MAYENITFPIYNDDGSSFHDLIIQKSSFDSVVMSLDDKITGDIFYKDNTLSFTFKEYIIYKGTKYYLDINTPPTIVRKGLKDDNNELKSMTKYSLSFFSPMLKLYDIPFRDAAVS